MHLLTLEYGMNVLTQEELTERIYLIGDQRDKLLWACQKALAAFDAANSGGHSTWSGKDVDEMRAAVAACCTTCLCKETASEFLTNI